MIWFFAVLLLILGIGSSATTEEHTKAPASSTQAATPKATPTPRRTTRRRTKTTRKAPPKKPLATTVADEVGWSTFTSKAGRFSVLLPGTPTEQRETKQSDQGPYTIHLVILKDQRNRFVVGWVDYPPSFNPDWQLELEMNRDKFVENQKATLLTSRQIRIDGHQVIEFTAETPEQIFRSRVYMVGRRPYQIIIGSPRGLDDSENINKFFNSFKISAT